MKFHWLLLYVLVAAVALGQAPQDKGRAVDLPLPSPLAPAITVSEEDAYLFPPEERLKVRDLQHEYDQLEIDTQKMQVKIEQNKARQAAAMDAIKLAAYQFSQAKKINLELYELDPK